jgi:hypothetical protein
MALLSCPMYNRHYGCAKTGRILSQHGAIDGSPGGTENTSIWCGNVAVRLRARSRRKRVLEGILVSEAGVQHAKSPPVSNSLKAIPGILTFLLVITSLPALAGQMTVSNLQEICSRSDKDSKKACDYYILGVTEGINKAATFVGDKKTFCIPESVSLITLEIVNQENDRGGPNGLPSGSRSSSRSICPRSYTEGVPLPRCWLEYYRIASQRKSCPAVPRIAS